MVSPGTGRRGPVPARRTRVRMPAVDRTASAGGFRSEGGVSSTAIAGSGGGGADSGGAAGALGPDGGPPDGGGGAEVGGGGTGGSSDARDAEATPPDTMTSDAGPCSSGLPEMGKLIIARCGANTAPK